jgi:hypothetical protein
VLVGVLLGLGVVFRLAAAEVAPVASKAKAISLVLAGGIAGGLSGYLLQYWTMVVDYPMNVGGRPVHSWPAFIPLTFELTILGASLAAVLGMLALNGLPQPYHPLFNVPDFSQATQQRFFLCIEAADRQFDETRTTNFLHQLDATKITLVEY